jgi:Tol biopolymer transport system component
VARADGSGAETLLFEDPEHDVWPFSVSSDGKWMLYGNGVASGTPHGSLWIRPMQGNAPPRMLIPEAEQFSGARFSPDARWITFSASVSGRSEVYVSPVPSSDGGLSARWQVSGNGGDRPRWRGDGKELYYVRPDGMVMAATVDGGGNDFRVIGEMPLFQVFQRIITQTIEPTADGQYFVINTLGADEAEPLAIVTHWLQSLPQP